MKCAHPVLCLWDQGLGGVRRNVSKAQFLHPSTEYTQLILPCGKCLACRLNDLRDKSTRAYCEATLWKHNSFITLTYNEAPDSLIKEDPLLFIKKLRYHHAPHPLRYYIAGEYGTQFKRPHYHICVFGYAPNDVENHSVLNENGDYQVVRYSKFLTKLWGKGFVSCSPLTPGLIDYALAYIGQKFYRLSDDELSDPSIEREYGTASRMPGLGFGYLEENFDTIVSTGYIPVGNSKRPVPLYFLRKIKEMDHRAAWQLTQKTMKREITDEQITDRISEGERLNHFYFHTLKLKLKK